MCIMVSCNAQEYDLTVVGRVHNADGLSRIPITLIEMLKEDLKINHILPFETLLDTNEINDGVKAILWNPDKTPGAVSILVDCIWSMNLPTYTLMPDSPIKIAYSMWESNQISSTWVNILNQYFDAVAVPDSFVLNTYRDSGVTIPIFELPLCLYLDDFLTKPKPIRPHSPFVFGCTATACQCKNQALLIRAFAEEFGNNEDVILRLSSRRALPTPVGSWENLIQSCGCNNIFINVGFMNNAQYLENMVSLDCYINISKGEGFSIGPREALALGLPCILSNNSAQKTICQNGLVRPVPSNIPAPPPNDCDWVGFFGHDIGLYSDCRLEDVKDALRDVYKYYDIYLEQAKMGPEWSSQYDFKKLKSKYLSLTKPKRVILGSKNEITDDYLMTASKELYNKYRDTLKIPGVVL